MAAPFSLALGSSVTATVTSVNSVGNSPESPAGNGAVIIVWYVPDAPLSLTNDAIVTSRSQIRFTWQDGISNGGKPVLEYRVNYDQALGAGYIILYSGVTVKEYLASVNIQGGKIYKFTVEARNVIGYSPAS
jgi:hypothetical protein